MSQSGRQKLFEVLNNNLAGELMGASNRMIEDAMSDYWVDKDYRNIYSVMEMIRIRMCHHAQVLLPQLRQSDGTYKSSMVTHSVTGTEHYVVFTGYDKSDSEAGDDMQTVDLRILFEKVLISNADGIVINPGRENGFLKRDGNIQFHFAASYGFPLFKAQMLSIMKTYYNPRFRIEAVCTEHEKVSTDTTKEAFDSKVLGGLDQEQKKQMLSDYYTGALDAARGDNHHSIKLLCVQDTDEKLIREIAEISFQVVYKWILNNPFCPMRILFVSDNHEVYRIYLEQVSM